jgi:hypothetical protein
MDDFVISNLHEARNEWCSRLVSIFSPLVIEGIRSIFNESWKMCQDADELGKYLMTFQNLLSRVPKWNSVIVEEERKRIIERSGCNYLEDLISCVHIIQLKVLTCIRVGNKQKKIDISIPKLDTFIHKVYIHVARKVYTNVYLFEKNISPLQVQKNGRELELIVQECILTTIRESVPTESIIRAYMDEHEEHEEEVFIEHVNEPVMSGSENGDPKTAPTTVTNTDLGKGKEDDTEVHVPVVPSIKNIDDEPVTTKLTFNNFDSVLDTENREERVDAPKTLERLESISVSRALERKQMEEDSDDEEEDRIKIHMDSIDLAGLDDVFDLDGPGSTRVSVPLNEDPVLDFEEL